MATKMPSLADKLNGLEGASVYYTDAFRKVIEFHLPMLRSSIYTHTLNIDPGLANMYMYDFIGLLTNLQVQPAQQWITMRLNGLLSPTDYMGDITAILIPDNEILTSLIRKQSTVQKIS